MDTARIGLGPAVATLLVVLLHVVIVVPVTLYGGIRLIVERRPNG